MSSEGLLPTPPVDVAPPWTHVEWAEIDMENARLFGELLTEAVQAAARDGQPTVSLDLTGVQFIDSQGLREVVLAARRGTGVGVALALHGIRPPVLRLLELTGVSELVTIPVPRISSAPRCSAAPSPASP